MDKITVYYIYRCNTETAYTQNNVLHSVTCIRTVQNVALCNKASKP